MQEFQFNGFVLLYFAFRNHETCFKHDADLKWRSINHLFYFLFLWVIVYVFGQRNMVPIFNRFNFSYWLVFMFMDKESWFPIVYVANCSLWTKNHGFQLFKLLKVCTYVICLIIVLSQFLYNLLKCSNYMFWDKHSKYMFWLV
jgi:hypothetical protein